MNSSTETEAINYQQYADLVNHPKPKVRKWASEHMIAFAGERALPELLPLISEQLDEIAIPVMSHLAESGFRDAAPAILEELQQAERNLPARSARASWCAQALGKLGHQPALPFFAQYLKRHQGDVGLLGICSALGDIVCPDARQMLREMLKKLESSRDGGVPYLGDVVIDSLLRHRYLEDIASVIKVHQVWQNDGHKSPRTISALARSAGENEIYPRMEKRYIRDRVELIEAFREQEALMGIELQKGLGALVYRGLTNALQKEQPSEIIVWSRQAAEEILLERYGDLETFRDGWGDGAQDRTRSERTEACLRDRLSLEILDCLNNPLYRIHRSQMDLATGKRQAMLALSALLETAGRFDYQGFLEQSPAAEEVIKILSSTRWHVPREVEERAVSGLASDEHGWIDRGPVIDELNAVLESEEENGYGRMRAARVLGRIGYKAAIPSLIDSLEKGQQWLFGACVDALVDIGTPVLDYLEENMSAVSPGSWAGIAEVLARMPYQRSAQIAYQAWQDSRIPNTDGLFMVHEKVGCSDSIAYLWEIYQQNPNMVGSSLELLCDIHKFDLPELDAVREANRLEEEENLAYQQSIWQEIKGDTDKEKYEMILNSDESKKTAPVQADKQGRNDPCPCGSGKKFKKCCGR